MAVDVDVDRLVVGDEFREQRDQKQRQENPQRPIAAPVDLEVVPAPPVERRQRETAENHRLETANGRVDSDFRKILAVRPIHLTMPETMSVERRKVLKALGANLILTPGSEGMAGAIGRAEQMVAADPKRFLLLQQFKNPANPEIHFRTTGPEIWEDTDGSIDVLVSGIGTGGTISGIARYIKKDRGKKILAVGIEPQNSPVISQHLAGKPIVPGPHKVQGIGAGFIPDTLDLTMLDQVELVTNEESIEMARRLAKEEGILSGISCGAAAAVAVRLGKLPEFAGKTIVTVLPDAAERYLSTVLFEGLFDE